MRVVTEFEMDHTLRSDHSRPYVRLGTSIAGDILTGNLMNINLNLPSIESPALIPWPGTKVMLNSSDTTFL